MNCQKASNLLSAYLDRELSSEERRQLRLHLLSCNECAEELQQIEEIKGALGRLCVVNVPPIIPWLRAQLAAGSFMDSPPVLVWQHPWFRRTCAVAALLLMFALGSWLLIPQQHNTKPGQISPFPAFPDGSLVNMQRFGP